MRMGLCVALTSIFYLFFHWLNPLCQKHKGFQQQKLEGRKSLVILFSMTSN